MGKASGVYFDVSIAGGKPQRVTMELFAHDAPRTCENFRCLCTGEKGLSSISKKPLHFKGSVFHRIIRGFMAQGGDFTNFNGTGGESIYGRTFDDEAFVRKHDEPFLLSMANRGPNTNGSQFFITFRSVPHLDGKHIVFGKVVDGTDVLRGMERVKTGLNDRPIDDVRIVNCGEISKEGKGDEKPAKTRARRSRRRSPSVSSLSSSGSDNSASSRSSRSRSRSSGSSRSRSRSYSSSSSCSSYTSSSGSSRSRSRSRGRRRSRSPSASSSRSRSHSRSPSSSRSRSRERRSSRRRDRRSRSARGDDGERARSASPVRERVPSDRFRAPREEDAEGGRRRSPSPLRHRSMVVQGREFKGRGQMRYMAWDRGGDGASRGRWQQRGRRRYEPYERSRKPPRYPRHTDDHDRR